MTWQLFQQTFVVAVVVYSLFRVATAVTAMLRRRRDAERASIEATKRAGMEDAARSRADIEGTALAASDAAHAAMESSLATLNLALPALNEAVQEVAEWKKKFEATFRAVEHMERERNEWKEMYYAAGRGHMNAQEMLFREIERLSMACKLPVKPHLADLVNGYREKHVLSSGDAEAKVEQGVKAAEDELAAHGSAG